MDLSKEMLDRARRHVAESGLTNVSFRQGSMADLSAFRTGSIGAVISSMALHHLPTVDDLRRTLAETARVLRPDGGVYLADFGRLWSHKSIHYFAYQYDDRQPELFTMDYLYSLKAAFAVGDFREAAKQLAGRARVFNTFSVAYMVSIKSPPRGPVRQELVNALSDLRAALPPHHERDLKDLLFFFRLGGLKPRLLK